MRDYYITRGTDLPNKHKKWSWAKSGGTNEIRFSRRAWLKTNRTVMKSRRAGRTIERDASLHELNASTHTTGNWSLLVTFHWIFPDNSLM